MQENKLNAIEKALEILIAFTPYNEGLGTGEISGKLGLHSATASRILHILADKGFLQQDPHSKRFTLGPAAFDIGQAYINGLSSNLVQLAKPYVDGLRSTLGETVVLEVLSGSSTVMAYMAEGPQRVHIAGTVGDRPPVNAAAGAKAILAFEPPDVVDKLLGGDLCCLTERTITDRDVYKRELKKIRSSGYSLDEEEIDIGINAVGAPIFNHEGKPVAAVVVIGPVQRINGESSSDVVIKAKKAAAEISKCLNYKEQT